MTTTDTRNVQKTVEQVKRCADKGADLVRITVQGQQEADKCCEIREQLFKDRYDIPLVADIHFQPKIAMRVAEAFEKIRVNPGNFADGAKKFKDIVYDDETEFNKGRERIEELLTPLIEKCKRLNRAMRIGTNHGSLSARILSFYGDTPRGMVESAFEFADICRQNDYHNFLFSMKASNPLVMVQAYRLLCAEMYKKDWHYPLHLGVTEAGEGEDGRMKSAIGIGSLLLDGLGDTIRVSLTEDPEFELEPCRTLARLGEKACLEGWGKGVPEWTETRRDLEDLHRRVGKLPEQLPSDGNSDFRNLLHRDGSVFSSPSLADVRKMDQFYQTIGCKIVVGMPFKDIASVDSLLLREAPKQEDTEARLSLKRLQDVGLHAIFPADELEKSNLEDGVSLFTLQKAIAQHNQGGVKLPPGSKRFVVSVDGSESEEEIRQLKEVGATFVLLNIKPELSRVHASRRFFELMARFDCDLAVIHHAKYPDNVSRDEIVIQTGSEVGALLIDGLGDGALLEARDEDLRFNKDTAFGMLQACRMRNTKTEYVSCPSCGRTLFDLQEVTEQIRQRTGHLPGVAVAVMGCIVNGPGEMADADFGYVGGAPGKIDLYVGKEVVQRGIPFEQGCDELINLIKKHDRWVEPEAVEDENLVKA